MKKNETKALAVLLACSLLSTGVTVHTKAKAKPAKMKTTLTVVVGKKVKLKVTGKYIKKIKFSSSNKKIATISKKGMVAGKKKGSCTLKAKVTFKKKYKKTLLKCKLTVKNKKKVTPTPSPIPYNKTAFSKNYKKTSFELLKDTSSEDIKEGKNVCISPLSAVNAMGLVMNGAANNTLTELKKTLCNDMEVNEYDQGIYDTNKRFTSDKNVKFHNANSMWFNDTNKLTINESFKNKNKRFFNATSETLPFDDAAVKKINNWVYTNTNKMIPNIIDRLTSEDMAVLVNALTFEGTWFEQFKDNQISKDQDFTNSKGEKEKTTMLCDNSNDYYKGDDSVGFSTYYSGGFEFVTILPNKDVSMTDYVNSLTPEKFDALLNNRQRAIVHTKLPTFSFDYDTNFVNPFIKMGIVDLFNENTADLSALGKFENRNIYVSDILHKTHIEVDRYGTKAAAVTAVITKATAMKPEKLEEINIFLDRPFLFAIVDSSSKLPVFIGVVNSVK